MSWQQQQRLPRIVTDGSHGDGNGNGNGDRRQMGPPSQSLPSINYRQLAPLRSPNLPSSTHSSSYFGHQRNRSTSESTVDGGAFRPLRPNLPEPPSVILPSAIRRGETLPPLAGFGQPSTPGALLSDEIGRSSKHIPLSQSSHYHPYHHAQHQSPSTYRQPPHYHSPPASNSMQTGAAPYYPGLQGEHHDRRFYSPSSSHNYHASSRESSTLEGDEANSRKLAKSHVPSACLNCKRAHLACDVSRPCRRCINLGKTDTCIDVQHKKRGRPRLRDREAAAAAAAAATLTTTSKSEQHVVSGLPSQRMRGSISSSSSTSTMRQSPRSEPTLYLSPTGDSTMLFSPSNKAPSSTTSMNSRGRSVSSSASLWAQAARPGNAVPPSDYPSSDSSPTVSLILSTGLQCARCSVESHALLGFAPSDLVERSLFELVHPSETNRLEQLWLSLIEPVEVKPQVVPSNAETIMNLSPALLMAPAPGTVFMQETMRLRQRSGIFDFYSIRLHLGGGFGADLYQPQTFDRAYIVASLLKLGNDATHPDPSILREARWSLGGDPRHFSTPQSKKDSQGRGEGMASEERNGSSFASNAPHRLAPTTTDSSQHDWQLTTKESSQQSRSVQAAPYSRNHLDEYPSRRLSRAYSTHDMDLSPPSTAKQSSHMHTTAHADLGSTPSIRPSLAKANSTPVHFSHSSRAERGGITC